MRWLIIHTQAEGVDNIKREIPHYGHWWYARSFVSPQTFVSSLTEKLGTYRIVSSLEFGLTQWKWGVKEGID